MRVAELIVAAFLIAIGAVVMWDSVRIGAGWAPDGPKSGYFPFYVSLGLILSSLVVFVRAAIGNDRRVFVARRQFGPVLSVFVPTTIFVLVIPWIGIYFATAIFIAYFMWWIGGYRDWTILPVAVGVPLATFCVFEIWFLVPLPKGPIETMLGY